MLYKEYKPSKFIERYVKYYYSIESNEHEFIEDTAFESSLKLALPASISRTQRYLTASGVLKPAERFTQTIAFLRDKLHDASQSLFVNVRYDTFMAEDTENETTSRLKLYESAGADGIFLPFISKEEDIANAVASTRLPLNVMCIPGLPEIDM